MPAARRDRCHRRGAQPALAGRRGRQRRQGRWRRRSAPRCCRPRTGGAAEGRAGPAGGAQPRHWPDARARRCRAAVARRRYQAARRERRPGRRRRERGAGFRLRLRGNPGALRRLFRPRGAGCGRVAGRDRAGRSGPVRGAWRSRCSWPYLNAAASPSPAGDEALATLPVPVYDRSALLLSTNRNPRANQEIDAMSEWERLRQGLQPELYRGNAFRVTNLAVDATLRDIDRQWKRLQMRQKLGSSAAEAAGLLPLTPPADLAAVREAVERLREPEKRFFDEFFWFWPAANDPALPALARGDFSAARTAWQTAAGPDAAGAVARHNLAVLMHVLALDLECSAGEAKPTSSVRAEQRDRCWAEALLAWKALLEQGEFWELVKERIRTRNEPQLKTDLAFHFREHLPVALLGINAQLALRAAERGAAADMARHKDILSRAGFDTAASTAVRLALKPIRARIQRLCQTEAGANQADNWRAGLLLFQRILPIP